MESGGRRCNGQPARREVRIVIADADRRVRSALRLLLEEELSAVVAGEVATARAALAEVATQKPDVLVLDWDLVLNPTASVGCAVMSRLRRRCPALSIVALSGEPADAVSALAAGADEFVSKGQPPERLLDVLRSVVLRRPETDRAAGVT